MPRKLTVEDFWSRVDKSGNCWLWTGPINDSGYGTFARRGKAHRIAYELVIGPVPEGLQLDHLCRVRACVRPAHLEPVTIRENLLRGVGISAQNAAKTHCPSGHPYTPDNLTGYRPGTRDCRTCARAKAKATYEAERDRGLALGFDPAQWWRMPAAKRREVASFLR